MEKKVYEQLKDIKTRVATGQTTTFKERNWMTIVLKKEQHKRNKIKECSYNQ